MIELMQSSEGRCSRRRAATRPRPRRAKLTVSVSSMYSGIRQTDHAGPGRAAALGGGSSQARHPGKRGTCPATHPPLEDDATAFTADQDLTLGSEPALLGKSDRLTATVLEQLRASTLHSVSLDLCLYRGQVPERRLLSAELLCVAGVADGTP